eukprot:360121-Chlamydomonas_euryale.AAC.7
MDQCLDSKQCPPSSNATYVQVPAAMTKPWFGRALNIVGVVAAVYHSSSGHARRLLRKVDYYSIAYSSAVLRSEAIGRVPRMASRIMLLGTAFKPTLVTGVNFVAVEVSSARSPSLLRALRSVSEAHERKRKHLVAVYCIRNYPQIKLATTALRSGSRAALHAWLRHAGISLSAITVFKAESARGFHPAMELCHALWHCLAAGAMLSVAPVLQMQLCAMVPMSTSLAPPD